MRFIRLQLVTLLLTIGSAAQAAVSIVVDKNTQQMTVAVDGTTLHVWPVSSGNPSHETPNGSFRAFRMEEDHYSKEFDDAPMPHAIFFTKQGHAIHGTDSVGRLGSPASHGCVRLSRANAKTLWEIVKAEGVLNTTVTLTGSSQVALARNPRPPPRVAATREPAPQYDVYGRPLQSIPQPRAMPQPNLPDDGDNDIGRNNPGAMYPLGRSYAGRSYQQREYYSEDDRRWRAQQPRRIYVDPRTGQRYYLQESEADDERYDPRPRYYYGPRGGY